MPYLESHRRTSRARLWLQSSANATISLNLAERKCERHVKRDMEQATVVVKVEKGKRAEALLEEAIDHWKRRALPSEPAVAEAVRAQLELLLRLYSGQEIRSTLHLPTARIKFIIQSEQ